MAATRDRDHTPRRGWRRRKAQRLRADKTMGPRTKHVPAPEEDK